MKSGTGQVRDNRQNSPQANAPPVFSPEQPPSSPAKATPNPATDQDIAQTAVFRKDNSTESAFPDLAKRGGSVSKGGDLAVFPSRSQSISLRRQARRSGLARRKKAWGQQGLWRTKAWDHS